MAGMTLWAAGGRAWILASCGLAAASCTPIAYLDFGHARATRHSMQPLIDEAVAKKWVAEWLPGHARTAAWDIPFFKRYWHGFTASGHPFLYSADNDELPDYGVIFRAVAPCYLHEPGDSCDVFSREISGLGIGDTWQAQCKKELQLCWAYIHAVRLKIFVREAGPFAVCMDDGWTEPPVRIAIDDRSWTITARNSLLTGNYAVLSCLTGDAAADFLSHMRAGAQIRTQILYEKPYTNSAEHTAAVDETYADAIRLARYFASRIQPVPVTGGK
jgi:hypothetical protein